MNLSSLFGSKKSSGLFVPNGLNFKELTTYSGKGSINDYAKHLGYEESQFHTYFGDFDTDNDINVVLLKVFTKDVICVVTKDRVVNLAKSKVDFFLRDFQVSREYDSVSVKSILEKGIEDKSLSIKFLSEVFNIENTDSNGVFFVKKINLFLHFSNGFLVDFQTSNGLTHWANYFMDINPEIINNYEKVAKLYWGTNTTKVLNEINIQAESLAGTPNSINNEYTTLHLAELGTINFAMLLVCHYDKIMTFKEFMEINHGRVKLVNAEEQKDVEIYKVGRFHYEFLSDGSLSNYYLAG